MTNLEGFLLINKTQGITSYDVIRYFKKQGITKIGHTGTLDPNTEGLLVLAIGRATKFIPLITENSQKEYLTTMKFGIQTTTGDITGEVVKTVNTVKVTNQEIEQVIKSFIKIYKQVPPLYSAKKINGKKAYEYGRNNQAISMEIRAKEVQIYDIEILKIDLINLEVTFKTVVSKGTYIRSLIEDIATKLKTVATMTSLIRTKTDGFLLENALEKEAEITSNYLPLSRFLKTKYPNQISVSGKLAQLIKNGVQVNNENIIEKFDKIVKNKKILILDENSNEIIALYKKVDNYYQVEFMVWREGEKK